MKWYRKIAENKKPTYTDHLGMVWTLWETRWFGIGIVLRARSDSTFDQRAESNRSRLVLEGQYLEHYEIPRTGDYEAAIELPADAYTYGNQYGLWACRTLSQGDMTLERVGRRGGVELLAARNQADALVDLPNWMQHRDVIFDAERPVFMLVLTWGGCWR
jgi:hypothetical protein